MKKKNSIRYIYNQFNMQCLNKTQIISKTYRSYWDCFKCIGTAINNCFFSNNQDAAKWWRNWYQQISPIVKVVLCPRTLNKIFILQSNFICFDMASIFVILQLFNHSKGHWKLCPKHSDTILHKKVVHGLQILPKTLCKSLEINQP